MRASATYRAQRRNDWRKLNGVGWDEYNDHKGLSNPWRIGSGQFADGSVQSWVARSKYMPHIGKKERARRVGAA